MRLEVELDDDKGLNMVRVKARIHIFGLMRRLS